jgi:Spirocyclase AveC-like
MTTMTRETHGIQTSRLRTFSSAFAVIGTLIVAYQIMGYLLWITGPNFVAVAPGPDPIPSEMLAGIRGQEQSQMTMALCWTLFLAGYSMWRRSLTWPVVLTIVWTATFWQEPLINAANQAFTTNLYFFNRGDWISSLPLMPIGGPTMTEPLKMEFPGFYMLNPLFSMMAAGLMIVAWKYLRIRNAITLFLIGAGFGFALDAYSELFSIKAGILAWNKAYPALSVRAGSMQQWPVYEGIMLGTLWAFLGILYFFRGENRFSPWDHGLNFITSPAKRNTAIVFMLVGCLNTPFMAYNLVAVGLSTMSPAVSGFPSYLGGVAR